MDDAVKKILIVEDDMILSMVLERMIGKLGHEVVDKKSLEKLPLKQPRSCNLISF